MSVKLFNKTFGTCWHGTTWSLFPSLSSKPLCNQSTPMVSGFLQHPAAPISALMAWRCWCNETDVFLTVSCETSSSNIAICMQLLFRFEKHCKSTANLKSSSPEIDLDFAKRWLENFPSWPLWDCMIVFPGVRCSVTDWFQIWRPVSCNSWGDGRPVNHQGLWK